MVAIQQVGVSRQSEDGIELEGDYIGDEWEAHRYGDAHIILGKKGDHSVASMGWCETDVLIAILHGLIQRGFSGTVSLKMEDQQKSILFHNGQLVFARSDLMDDRLGEVIYRAGLITLEQMMDAAVQVTRDRKFGKVLLESDLFTSSDLWDALKMQVLEIFQSIFLVPHVHYVIKERTGSPPISVVFEESTESLIENCASFGQMFRSFKARIDTHSAVTVQPLTLSKKFPKPGTFFGDIIDLLRENPSLDGYLSHSKLGLTNSYLALFHLVMQRIIDVEDSQPVQERVGLEQQVGRRELKSLIDAYHVTRSESKKAFESNGLEFPLNEIRIFLEKKYSRRRTPIFLKNDGTIASESVRHLYAKCRDSKKQQKIAVWELQSLIQFLLQITGDLVPGQGWSIKQSIQEMLE